MISVRTARKDEVGDLQNLDDEIFVDSQKYDSDFDTNWAHSTKGKTYFTDLLNNPKACCLIAEDNGVKVGYIAAGPKSISYRRSKYIEIENIGVIPEYRLKGIGVLLIEKCLKWAKSEGFQKAYVNAYFHDIKAIEFYKRNSFSEIDLCLERLL